MRNGSSGSFGLVAIAALLALSTFGARTTNAKQASEVETLRQAASRTAITRGIACSP